MNSKYLFRTSLLFSLLLFLGACEEEEYAIPEAKTQLQNDVIKRSIGPNLVGLPIEFAYAMALAPQNGSLVSAQVEASIAGAPGTYLENKSYHTNGSGTDVGVQIGEASVTEGKITKVVIIEDTSAATLRYYYVVPEEARGKTVSFTFSAASSNGENVSFTMGPYNVSKMDVVLNLDVKDGGASYISIADMAVYDEATAAANPDKVDLVYLYRSLPGITFGHALVAPAADAKYLPGVTLPVGVDNNTKLIKAWGLRDHHLSPNLQYGVYIDDLDFQVLNMTGAPNFAINLKQEAGTWVETEDGKYRAYILVNSVNNGGKSAKISIKRYAL